MMQSDAFYNEEPIDTTTFTTNDKMFEMAVERFECFVWWIVAPQ